MLRFLLIAALVTATARGEEPGDLASQFLQGVTEMGRKIEDVRGIQARISIKWTQDIKGESQATESETEVAKLGGFLLRKELGEHGFIVSAINDSYGFVAKEDDGSPELMRLEELGVSPDLDENLVNAIHDAGVLNAIFASFFFGVPLNEFVTAEGFSIISAEQFASNNQDRVRIEYTYPKGFLTQKITDCYFVCAPDQGWAIVESGSKRHYPSDNIVDNYRFEYSLGEMVGEVPFVTQARATISREDGTYSSESVSTNEIVENSPDPEMFFLSYYGLPEPDFNQASGGRPRFWAISLSLGILICAISYYLRKRSGGQ